MAEYGLITLNKNGVNIKLLFPLDADLSLITANAPIIFDYHQIMKAALTDLLNDYSSQIREKASALKQLKECGCIGYPLDMHDPVLYAHDRNLMISEELEVKV